MCKETAPSQHLEEYKKLFREMNITGFYFAPLVNTHERGQGVSKKVIDKVTIANRLRCKINLELVYFSDTNVRNCFAVFKENFISSDPFFMEMSNMEVKTRVFQGCNQSNLKQAQWQAVMNRFGYLSRGASVFKLSDANPLLGVLIFFSDLPPARFAREFATREEQFNDAAKALGNQLITTLNTESNPWVALGAISKKSHKILQLLAEGMDTADISRIMSLTKRGVDYHIETLKELLQSKNRVQLVVKALKEGIIGYPKTGAHVDLGPEGADTHWPCDQGPYCHYSVRSGE